MNTSNDKCRSTQFQHWAKRDTPTLTLYIASGLLVLLLVFASIRMETEPFWLFLAAPVSVLLLLMIRRFPVAPMVAIAYVGSFKTHAALGISVTDPTLVAAAVLYAAVFLALLLVTTGTEGYSLRDLFAGQMLGVTAVVLLILVIAISYSYTPAPLIGSDKVLKLIAFDMPAFVAPLLFLRTDREVRQLVLLHLTLSLVLAGRIIYRVLHPGTDLLSGDLDPTQISEGVLIAATVLMVMYYPLATRRVLRVLLIVCVVTLTIATAASLSRSAVLSLLLVATAGSVFLHLDPEALSKKAIAVALGAVIVAVAVTIIEMEHLPATYSKLAQKAGELSAMLRGATPPGTAGQRYSFADSAWQAFLSRPLFGWGAGGWSTLWHYSYDRPLTYPHNFVLEIAAEQGIAGLTALALLLVAIFWACGTLFKASESRFVFIVPVVMMCLLSHLFTGSIEDRVLWLWCGTLFALARIVQQRRQHQCKIST